MYENEDHHINYTTIEYYEVLKSFIKTKYLYLKTQLLSLDNFYAGLVLVNNFDEHKFFVIHTM